MDIVSVNYLAVLVAAIVAYVIGFMWHGPLFGKQWIRLMEIPQAKINEMQAKGMSAMAPQMVTAFVQQLIIAWVLALLIANLQITDVIGALSIALLLWLGFIVTTHLNEVLWGGKKMRLYLFNMTYLLVSFIVIGLIVMLWR